MNPRDRLDAYLRSLGLEATVVSEILTCFRPRTLRRKQTFARMGEQDDRLGFVGSGLFSMEVVHPDGRLFIKDFLGEGAFLLASFDPGEENRVTLTALRDSWILEARYSEVRGLQDRHSAFGTLARKGMERRYLELCTRLERLTGLNASDRYQAFRIAYQAIEKEIPLHLVAAYLNITPTQLSRIRRDEKLTLST